jgi:hypothetical protein
MASRPLLIRGRSTVPAPPCDPPLQESAAHPCGPALLTHDDSSGTLRVNR